MYDIRPNQDYAPQPTAEPAPSVTPDPNYQTTPPVAPPPTNYDQQSDSAPPAIPRGNMIGSISGVIIILTILLVGGLFGYDYLKKSKISTTMSKLDSVNSELNSLAETDKKVIALQSQIDNINLALAQRNYYSKFFAKLTPLIPKDTVFTTLSFAEGEIQVSGQAASFDSVARLLASIRDSEEVESVSLASASAGDTSRGGLAITFSMSMKVGAGSVGSTESKTVNTSGGIENTNQDQENLNQSESQPTEGLAPESGGGR